MSSLSPLKILVLPVFRRYWLYHAFQDSAATELASRATENINWRKGVNLEEKLSLLGTKLSAQLYARIVKQWRDLEAAKEGSIKRWFYKQAQSVLAREEPEESFLKAIPAEFSDLQIIYPSSLNERLVRRRLRLLLKERTVRHTRRLATPIPNIPLYYCGYKAYSNQKAVAGANTLRKVASLVETRQMEALRAQLLALQTQGVEFPADSWPAKLLSPSHRYLDILDNSERKVQRFYKGRDPALLEPAMLPSMELDALVRPHERMESPIKDDAALEIGRLYGASGLFERVARARRRSTGAMFPTEIH